jgi:Cu+-exporting ATPase
MGILIRSGEALEKAGTIDTVILDKTGTVTIGRPTVVDIIPTQSQLEYPLLAIAASAERDSEHPLAKAIVQAAEDAQLALPATSGFQAEPGLGVRAELGDGKIIRVGNAEYLKSNNIDPSSYIETDNKLQEDGKTTVFVAVENQLVGILALADTVKPSAAAAIRQLSAKGFTVKLLTGDSQRTASAIARQLGITEVIADVLPQQKASVITTLRAEGRKVAMVGDGINDAPALIESDLGLAIGSGTDIAIESADIVLTRGDPLDVSRAIELSHLTLRAIKQNLFWAFAFNATAIPIAAGALYAFGGPLLNPIISALAMSVSSLTVMGNALRLKAKKL